MKKYLDNRTGEKFTMAELRQAFADAEIENQTFEDWFDEETSNARAGMDGLEEIEVNWFLVDEKGADIFTEVLDADDIARAISEASSQWEWLTAYDKKQRNAFYIVLAEEDEDGEMNWETIEQTVDIMNLDSNVLRAADIIVEGAFDAAVNLMDDEIREAIHFENPEMDGLEFLAEYLKRHEQKFGEEFTI